MTEREVWYFLVDGTGQLVEGTSSDAVDLPSSSSIRRFRDVVHTKNSAILTGIVPAQLVVYANKEAFETKGAPLGSRDTIGETLGSNDELYVVVPAIGSSAPEQLILGKRKLVDLRDDFPAPSSFAKFHGKGCWKDVLKKLDGQIDCHRITMDSDSLPITLMHPVFAEFVRNCQSAILTSESCTFANVLCGAMLKDYESEKEMAAAARDVLVKCLKVDLVVVNIKGSESDGSCRVNGQLILNLEVKTQSGSGSCDPSIQNLAYFIKQLPNVISCQLPCLLLDISGPLFGIYGAMNTDDEHIICEPLCPILPLHDVDNVLIRPLLSRSCAALQVAIESLKQLASPRGLSTFPYKTSVQIDGTVVTFRYLKRVTRYVFLVECTGADGSVYKAIAKFTKNYGKEVHEYCAKKGFAPKLMAYEEIPASWNFVLMENVEIESISRMDRIEKKQQLKKILLSLRSENFVHGDLRHTNVFWNRPQNRVILIDFDWSGRNGIQRYPSYMNPEVKWPDGASTGEMLSFDHDIFWINQLLN